MENYELFVDILNNELKPAMGCTEPIAIALCASKVKDVLGCIPTDLEIYVSGNIIKNVKSVKVPNTGGMFGIKAAAAIGIVAGDSSKELEVIANATIEDVERLKTYLNETKIKVIPKDTNHTLYIEIIGKYNEDYVKVVIKDAHTNITLIEKNNEILFVNEKEIKVTHSNVDKSVLNIKDIITFADCVDLDDVIEVIEKQIEYNQSLDYLDDNVKYSKYIVYINPENKDFIDSLTVKERKNLINRLLREQDDITITKRRLNLIQTIIRHCIISIITIAITIPVAYWTINASLEATINNYRRSKTIFNTLYKEKGKIKTNNQH